jgi:hypothetical protein
VQVGWRLFVPNVAFWACVLGAKISFDWFLVMVPLRTPVLGLWQRNWLGPEDGSTNALDIIGDLILCSARCLPAFLVIMNDMQARPPACEHTHENAHHRHPVQILYSFVLAFFSAIKAPLCLTTHPQILYYVVLAFFGAIKALLQLNIGAVATFQELVVTFHKAPSLWWKAGVSMPGRKALAV